MRAARIVLALLLGVPGTVGADDLLTTARGSEADLEAQVHRLLVDALEDAPQRLAADVAELEHDDRRRQAAGLAPSGLTDDARYLAATLAFTRDAQREALQALLDARPDPVVRRLAEHRLETDDAAAAERLLADDRHNRRAAVLNDAVRPLGIFSGAAFLAAVNPLVLAGSAIDSVVTTAVNLWHYRRLSVPEREALARYRTLLDREPQTQDAPEIARAINQLGMKRAAALCAETIAHGERALEEDDLDRARYYLRAAERLEDCADPAARPLARLEEADHERRARDEAGRWPADHPPQPGSYPELRDHEALMVATALGEPGRMIETAGRFRERYSESPLAPAALYVLAVARDLAGHREAGREALAEVARGGDSALARHADALLASPDFNRLEAIRDAERRHARATARYVLVGGRNDGRTALYGAAHLGAEGLRAAQSLGIFNVLGVVTRAWQVWRRDPISNQAIIDRGEEFLAREPGSPEAPAVHARLVDAYERSRLYGRALMHYRASADPDAGRIAKLEAKAADQLLERDGDNPLVLATIVRHFGATDAAERARKRLAEREPNGETRLERDLLTANPALLGPDALDLDPQLLDGERENGELAESGVTLAGGELRLSLRNEETPGERTETRPLSSAAYERARAAAEEALYARLLTTDGSDPGAGRFERYVPFYVQGSIDEGGGLNVSPGVKMRRYRSEERRLYE